MRWTRKPAPQRRFTVDGTILCLAMELGLGPVVRQELQRQFAEQFPGGRLTLAEANVHIPGFEDFTLDIAGYEVVIT